jgi:hypothetical protein
MEDGEEVVNPKNDSTSLTGVIKLFAFVILNNSINHSKAKSFSFMFTLGEQFFFLVFCGLVFGGGTEHDLYHEKI